MAKRKIEVTPENFGDLLIEGLREAVAIDDGEERPAAIRRRKLTARKVEVAPPPKYRPRKIVAVRNTLGVSQTVFAGILNVSSSTVRAWEQGDREPDGATRRLLEVAEKHPEVLTGAMDRRVGARRR